MGQITISTDVLVVVGIHVKQAHAQLSSVLTPAGEAHKVHEAQKLLEEVGRVLSSTLTESKDVDQHQPGDSANDPEPSTV